MISQPYYYNTIRKITIAFGTIFNELKIERRDSADNLLKEIDVPLQYITKEKFINVITQASEIDRDKRTEIAVTLPRMGFEMTGMSYAAERKTNTMVKILDSRTQNAKYMYNRVPYDINFSLHIATRKLDDSFRIIEQILPYFTPELTVKILDKEDYGISTNVPIVLNNPNFEIDAEGSFDDRRTIFWTLDFTAKAYLYAATKDTGLIKKTTVDLRNLDNLEKFEGLETLVDPETAGEEEPHDIITTTTT